MTERTSGKWVPGTRVAGLGEPIISSLGPSGAFLRLTEWVVCMIGCVWLLLPRRRSQHAWLLVAAALAIVGPPLLIGLPLVRYRASADPLFVVWIMAGGYTLYRAVRDRAGALHITSQSQASGQ